MNDRRKRCFAEIGRDQTDECPEEIVRGNGQFLSIRVCSKTSRQAP